MIKCISLHQPWATLVALGAKSYETRDWSPGNRWRGRLCIHAAPKPVTPQEQVVLDNRKQETAGQLRMWA